MDSQDTNSSHNQATGRFLQHTTMGPNQRPAQMANYDPGVVPVQQGSHGLVPGGQPPVQPPVQASQPAFPPQRTYSDQGGVVTRHGFDGFAPGSHMQPQAQAPPSAFPPQRTYSDQGGVVTQQGFNGVVPGSHMQPQAQAPPSAFPPHTASCGQIGGAPRPGFDGLVPVPHEPGYRQGTQHQFYHSPPAGSYVNHHPQPWRSHGVPPFVLPPAGVPNTSFAQNVAPQNNFVGPPHQPMSPYNTGPAFPHNRLPNQAMYPNMRVESWNHPPTRDGIHQLPDNTSYRAPPINQTSPPRHEPNEAYCHHSTNIPTSQAPLSAGIPAFGFGIPITRGQQHGRGQNDGRGPRRRRHVNGQQQLMPGQQQQLPFRTVSMNQEAGMPHPSIPGTSGPGNNTEQDRTQPPPSTPGPSQPDGSVEQERGQPAPSITGPSQPDGSVEQTYGQPAPSTPGPSQPDGSVEQTYGQPAPSTPGPSQPDGSVEQTYGQPAPSTPGPSQAHAEGGIANGDSVGAIPAAHGLQQHQIDFVNARFLAYIRTYIDPNFQPRPEHALLEAHSYDLIQQHFQGWNIFQQPGPGTQENAQPGAPAQPSPLDAPFSEHEWDLYFALYLEWDGRKLDLERLEGDIA